MNRPYCIEIKVQQERDGERERKKKRSTIKMYERLRFGKGEENLSTINRWVRQLK